MTKHTEGPLEAEPRKASTPDSWEIYPKGSERSIAKVFAGPRSEADAKLYAEAPMMLEALRRFIKYDGTDSTMRIREARAIIARIDECFCQHDETGKPLVKDFPCGCPCH